MFFPIIAFAFSILFLLSTNSNSCKSTFANLLISEILEFVIAKCESRWVP